MKEEWGGEGACVIWQWEDGCSGKQGRSACSAERCLMARPCPPLCVPLPDVRGGSNSVENFDAADAAQGQEAQEATHTALTVPG